MTNGSASGHKWAGKGSKGARDRITTLVLIGIIIVQLIILTAEILSILEVGGSASEKDNRIEVPIILYHSILRSDMITDRYAVTPSEFENDLVYIRDNGYTTITMSDLIGYVYDGLPLPQKPIILTFDDGFLNTYVYAYPLLRKYDMKAVLSIIGSYADAFTVEKSDNLTYAHATWDQIKEMADSGRFEIQNHSYSLHTTKKGRIGARMMRGEAPDQYEKVLSEDLSGLQQKIGEMTGRTPNTFVYPYGEISKESVAILKNLGFKASLSTYGGINHITRDPDVLYGLKRNDRPRGISSKAFFALISPIPPAV